MRILLRKRTLFSQNPFILCSFTFTAIKENRKKSYPVIKFRVLPFGHYYLTVAIISSVQNVRLHEPTCRRRLNSSMAWFTTDWSMHFAPHEDQTLAQLVDVLDYAVVHTLHALFCTFFPVSAVQKLLKSVMI